MKRIILALIFSSFYIELDAQTGFHLDGTISGLKDGTKICLIQESNSDTIAHAIVKKNRFIFKGRVPNITEFFNLSIDTTLANEINSRILITNDNIIVRGDLKTWPILNVYGSIHQNEHSEFVQLSNSVQKQSQDLSLKMEGYFDALTDLYNLKVINDSTRKLLFNKFRDQAIVLRKALWESYFERSIAFINQHLNSPYVGYAINYTFDLKNKIEKKNDIINKRCYYEKMTSPAKSSYFGKMLHSTIEKERKWSKIRQNYVLEDAIVSLPNGESTSLLETIKKGKYTLIDFWASWCGVCRMENKNLEKIYNEFHEKGFDIVGVAISDNSKKWQVALKEDKMPWTQVLDVNKTVENLFHLIVIPAYALVDQNGVLVALHSYNSITPSFGPPIKGQSLRTTLEELLITNNK